MLSHGLSGERGGDLPMLKTRDVNQNTLTTVEAVLVFSPNVNPNVVAVTEEKKVAMADRLSKLSVLCFWANWIVGTPRELQ